MAGGIITGRDARILAQALATTCAPTGTLPDECRREGNRRDMAPPPRAVLGEGWAAQAHPRRHVPGAEAWRDGKAPPPTRDDTPDDIDR